MSWRKKALWAVSFLFLVFVLAWFFRKPLLTGYARLFGVHTATKGANALVCLSGGKITRVPETLRLWNQGYAPSIYLTNEKKGNKEFSKLETGNLGFAREVVRKMELNATWETIPSLGDGATSTFDEAEDVLAYGKEKGWKRIIIVTDEFHTRRARYAFEKIFDDSGIEVEVAGASNEVFSDDDWWQSDRGISSYVLETIKFPVYLLWDQEPTVVRNN
ncbi:MAG: YdcF family protein [Opitutae bacterium]|jgi:hypothetical protein|nr:YdcF family protein [Opitutae bacterium]